MTEQKIEAFWRDATAEDIAKVMRGEKIEARFRDFGMVTWNTGRFLAGYDALSTTGMHWIASNANQWKFCQVYDPPAWFLNKPDPGEGWRLLKKFPDEPKLTTDEFFDSRRQVVGQSRKETFDNKWTQVGDTGSIQYHGVWYRRRIEPAAPTIKICDPLEIGAQYTQADRDFRKFVDKAQAGELSFTCTFLWDGNEFIRVKVGDRIQHPNGCCMEITENGFKVNATLDIVEFGK